MAGQDNGILPWLRPNTCIALEARISAYSMTDAGVSADYKINAQIVTNSSAVPTIYPATPSSVTITASSWSGGVITFTATNTFVQGNQVTVAGMTPSGYNGSYKVLTASGSQFTVAKASDPGTSTVQGTATLNPTVTTIYEHATAADWDVSIAAFSAADLGYPTVFDYLMGAVVLRATGAASKTIRWLGKVELLEIGTSA